MSLNGQRAASTFLYIDFTSRMQYYPKNSFMMMPSSTMPSGHLMKFSTNISGCRHTASTSNSSATHTSYFWYKVSPIIIPVDVSVANGENDSM